MSETLQPGLEVAPCTGLQVHAQPDANKYFVKAEEPRVHLFDCPIRPGLSDTKSEDWRKAFWVLALIAVLCIAAALGAGLGAGLTAQHRSTSPSESVTSNPADSSLIATLNPVVTTVESSKVVTITSVPPDTLTGTVLTITSTPSIPPTVPSPVCPMDDKSTYIATNKPSPTSGPELEIINVTLAYRISCYTNYVARPPVMDLQTISNVTSFHDCLDACALYSFQTKPIDFPAFACTGIGWSRVASATQFCWLKSNVTSSSFNGTDIYPGIDGAFMEFS